MRPTDLPADKGQCYIRPQIDAEAEVSERSDLVHIRTISGRDGRDDGSECNVPLPARDVQGFRFEVADGRGEIRLLSPPSRRSGYQAVVYIRDSVGGDGRYHFRLSSIRIGGGVFPGDIRNDFPGPRRDDDFRPVWGELFGSWRQPGDSDHRIVPLKAASTEMPFSVRMLPMARSSAARALT